jgi:hypothetical protein
MRCTHMAFGVSKKVARDAVREILQFLEEINAESRH